MSDNQESIKLKGEYLAEFLAARFLNKSIQNVREMVDKGELKGLKDNKSGQVSVMSTSIYFTPKTMALMMSVSERDVIDWIKSGDLKAAGDEVDYKIAYNEYTKFGQSGKWMPKLHDTMFEYIKKLTEKGEIIQEVNQGFQRGMAPHFEKAKEVINFLEQVHAYCDKKLDVLNDKTVLVAGHVVLAKIISILYSSLNMIEKGELIGASALFRTIYEGVDLVIYFVLSENTDKGRIDLNRWFRGENIKNPICSGFIVEFSKKCGLDKDGNTKKNKDKLYDSYCRLVHLNYHAIMESYNAIASRGFGQEKIHKIGFDYKSVKLMKKSVTFLNAFEGLLGSVLTTFLFYTHNRLLLEQHQVDVIQEYRDYYAKGVLERNEILRKIKNIVGVN